MPSGLDVAGLTWAQRALPYLVGTGAGPWNSKKQPLEGIFFLIYTTQESESTVLL